MNPNVDDFLLEGCGRCDLYQTPQCKVHTWHAELNALRSIMLTTGLQEDYKWSTPVYTFKGKNIALIGAFKHHVALAFFKGVLLKDTENLLIAPGKNTQSSRQFRFTDPERIVSLDHTIKAYVYEAVEIEKSGQKVDFKREIPDYPEELKLAFAADAYFEQAFEMLTPGRRRVYLLYFNDGKQSQTRINRIERWKPKILKGEGMQEKYSRKRRD